MTDFEKKIGYKFKNTALLDRALTHSSYANENGTGLDNERLEFLGDSVLGFITAEYLFEHYKNNPEGELTKKRAYAVCEKTLFGYAEKIGLGDMIKLGKGEERTGGRHRPSVVSDAFEALLAAVYLDGGIEEAKKFVLPFIETATETQRVFKDYKSILQEVLQQNPTEKFEYIVTGESGPDHNKQFTVEVHLNSNVIGRGVGSSKKRAEQEAARSALELMGL
ncbi:MAG: ribonuclease III [Oscillospiraceae bacterium]|nr:ribonuclease III [Oscillospiraceae bacterium]